MLCLFSAPESSNFGEKFKRCNALKYPKVNPLPTPKPRPAQIEMILIYQPECESFSVRFQA